MTMDTKTRKAVAASLVAAADKLSGSVEHRVIQTGPLNARDWRIICLCGARIDGNSVKDVKARWAEHAADLDAARETAFKAMPMAKALVEHLSLLKQQTPESHPGFKNISKALDAAHEFVADIRAIGHSFE